MYKTVSFPKHESGTGTIERLRLVINNKEGDFAQWLSNLPSKEIRGMLNLSYAELKQRSTVEGAAISHIAMEPLKLAYSIQLGSVSTHALDGQEQLALFPSSQPLGRHGTFSPNHIESIHRWYPYIEGFSSTFVQNIINRWGKNASSIYDPFAGTGTTMTVGALLGLKSLYSEINPFMRLVIEGKTNVLRRVALQQDQLTAYFSEVLDYARDNQATSAFASREFGKAFGSRKYFAPNRLVEIVSLREAITRIAHENPDFRFLALLALGSIAVQCSELKRAADLRYRQSHEVLPADFSVTNCFQEKVAHILDDMDESLSQMEQVSCLSADALQPPEISNQVDLIVTSPPYLNGTNYFRNTKIELWMTGLLATEKDLGIFTRQAVTAGINNVSNNGRSVKQYDFVEPIAAQLDQVAYDRRIPELVRRYCSDAEIWLSNCYKVLRPGGRAIVDIGDSRFAGIHVPTEKFLERLAHGVGFTVAETELVRSRTSKDGTPLSQVLLVLEKPQYKNSAPAIHRGTEGYSHVRKLALAFQKELPHQGSPFSSRNWGHPLHSLCSYQGKLKPAVAHFLVTRFTKPGQTVLDPMSGAGTIPLEAFLTGRKALANDLQELGFFLSFAKVRKPSRNLVIRELKELLLYVNQNQMVQNTSLYADFGFNGKLFEYFEDQTFKEILAARHYMQENPCTSTERALVFASLLHILHGNRPYALSRRSHPVTPLKPTGEYEYRDIGSRLTAKVMRAMDAHERLSVENGEASCGSFENLDYKDSVDAIITSPPFAASTRFYVANWLRLWMAGWEPKDFETRKTEFIEHRQRTSFDVYSDFFEKSHQWLKPGGLVIMHLGKTTRHNMAEELIARCANYFRVAHVFDECVAKCEKFGLKDQGATRAHQYLFLTRKD